MSNNYYRRLMLLLFIVVTSTGKQDSIIVQALQYPSVLHKTTSTTSNINQIGNRRMWIQEQLSTMIINGGTTYGLSSILFQPTVANAEFAPGGTLITDRQIGILVNNPDACTLRQRDNSNVLFDKDYYYKFGTGLQFIDPPGNTSIPKSMPFTKTQQRYDSLKKYQERITSGLQLIKSLPSINNDQSAKIADPRSKEDVYQLRAMGLLANGLLASDNNGIPNEVFVARYYINEIYLRIDELRSSSSSIDKQQQQQIYKCIEKATNSYLTLMNRVITSKVGEPFSYITMVTTSS
jgi:hypothetical protein